LRGIGRGVGRRSRRGKKGWLRVGAVGIEICGLTGAPIDHALDRSWGSIVVGDVVEAGCVGVRWGDAAGARSEDEFNGGSGAVLNEEHVAAGAVEEFGEDLGAWRGAIFAEDVLVGDAAGDLHSGLTGDFAENLVEAGVVR
jgi:hypothetical protein